MECRQQWSSSVHDPLGLAALPLAPMSAGLQHVVGDHMMVVTGGRSTGVQTALKTIGGSLIAGLVVISLVAPAGPGMGTGTPSRAGAPNAFARWCPHSNAKL
jgi:hypothetical protein